MIVLVILLTMSSFTTTDNSSSMACVISIMNYNDCYYDYNDEYPKTPHDEDDNTLNIVTGWSLGTSRGPDLCRT